MADQLPKVFAALADPIRREMVARLTVADATVSHLAGGYDVSFQAVSKHLKVLEDAGLVTRNPEAQTRPVHLEAEVFDLMTKWLERYRQQAEGRYRRLDALLAEMNEESDDREQQQGQQEERFMSKTGAGEATIEADKDVPIIRITRDFHATPAQLIRAHTDPELFSRWVGPRVTSPVA